jgi:hypothetical protein
MVIEKERFINNRKKLIKEFKKLAILENVNIDNEVNNYKYNDELYDTRLLWINDFERKRIILQEVMDYEVQRNEMFFYLNGKDKTFVGYFDENHNYWATNEEDYYYTIRLILYNSASYVKEIFEVYKKVFIEDYTMEQMNKYLKGMYKKIIDDYNDNVKLKLGNDWEKYAQLWYP